MKTAVSSLSILGFLGLFGLAAATAQTPPSPTPIGEVTLFGEEEFKIQAATKTEIPISKAPGAVTVIGAKQIRESGARTIPELLRLVAGVNVRWNPMVQTIDMRSFGQNPFTSRVLLLIDGVPYNSWNKGGFPQHPGFDFFTVQNVKRIEVIRGPGSALYGENAYWGVINIVTLSGDDLEGGKVEIFGGDLESRSLGVTYGRKVGEDGSFLVSGKFLQGQFPAELWLAEGSEVEAADVFVKGAYKGFEASYYHHEDASDGFVEPIPIPGLPPDAAFRSIESIEQEIDIFALKYNRKFAGDKLSFGGDLSYAQRDGSHCGACHAAQESLAFQDTNADHGFQLIGDFRLGVHDVGPHDLLFGVEARQIDAGDHSEELLGGVPGPPVGHPGDDVVFDYSKLAVYAQDQVSLLGDSLRVVLGLRYDGSNDLFDEELSPRIAFVYEATDALVLRSGWSKAFRFPNFSELYQASWFFTLSARGGALVIPLSVFVPNPDLRPEEIETFELGFQYRLSPSVSAKLDLFYSELDNFIVQVFDAAVEPVPLRLENHPDQATLWGAELELRWTFEDKLTGFVNWSYQEPDQKGNLVDSTGKPLEFVYAPENKLNLGLYFGPFAGWSGAFDVQWRDEVLAPSFWNTIVNGVPEIGVLESYTLVNLRLSYDLPYSRSGRQPPRISLYGKDLLDDRHLETLVGTDLLSPGSTLYGSFEFWF